MELELQNVGIIKEAHLEFIQGLNLIVGASSSGKSTLLRAIRSMVDNSFSDSNISYGEKKMFIKMIYNGHTAIYVRDLDNTQRKSAYKIDDTVYTKLGRSSLEEMDTVFKLSPIEIDGEKVNFNFSAQFSGPFLLLGSSSFLYSILTYRSSFDITKINDLYFTDIKKVKQDIRVLTKTKETLEKEKESKEKELQPLHSFPDVYVNVQRLKQQYDFLQRQSILYTSYKSTLRQIAYRKNKIDNISKALEAFNLFPERVHDYTLLKSYILCYKQAQKTMEYLKEISRVLDHILKIQPNVKVYSSLKEYVELMYRYNKNKSLLNKINIPDTKTLLLLHQYKKVLTNKNMSFEVLTKIDQQLKSVQNIISTVDVCPLCKQPICNH